MDNINGKKGLEALGSLKATLPPIQKEFKIEILSEEELTERNKLANDRKEMVQVFAKQEIEIRTALQLYKSKVRNWDQLPKDDELRMEIDRLQKRLAELVAIDGDLGEGKEFAKFVIEVSMTDEFSQALKMLERAVQEKRIWAPTRDEAKKARAENGKWPEGALVFPFGIWFQKLETPGSRILNKRLREMCKRALEDRVAKMIASGSHNLLGLRRGRIVSGKYYLHSSWNRDEKGRVRLESHTLVEVFDKNKGQKDGPPYLMMKLMDAFGGTVWMLEHRKPFPAFWFEKGQVLAREGDLRFTGEEREHIGHVIKVLNGIFSSWEKEQRKSEILTPKATETETSSHDDTVMPAKFDRTIDGTGGDEIKVFVKPKTKKE